MTVFFVEGTQHQEADYALLPEVMEALWRMEDRHFWHRARNGWILDALAAYGAGPPGRVLDVGCGSGAVSRALEHAGYAVTGVDTAEPLVRKAQERCPGSTFVVGQVSELPEPCRGPFSVVGFFDVLEHLDEPGRLLGDALRWAAPGALVIATVPALRALTTIVDELSGHKRRYERAELTALFATVGLRDVVVHGIFASTLAIQRRARKDVASPGTIGSREDRVRIMTRALRVPPFPLNALLGLVTRGERLLGLRRAQRSSGASFLVVGRKG